MLAGLTECQYNWKVPSQFTADYRDLDNDPRLGRVAVLPWDCEIFGFAVADYRPGELPANQAACDRLSRVFEEWAAQNAVRLCCCTVLATDRDWIAALPRLGFDYVDFTLRVTLPGLQSAVLPEPHIRVRPAEAAEAHQAALLAADAFRFGRYHADARFPLQLANARYGRWIENAAAAGPGSRLYVIGDGSKVDGFYHVTIERDTADLRLAAVAAPLQRTLLGFELYASTLAELKRAGVRRVVSRISAANTAVMNVYAMLGFRFSAPEPVFHWHSQDSDQIPRVD